MKQIVHISLLVLSIVLLESCSESSSTTTTLNVDKTAITIEAEGGTETFQITSNTGWTISTDNTDITVSPTSGTGNATVTVTLPMTWSIKERDIRLMIRSNDGAEVKNVVVTQKTKYLSGVTLTITNHGDNDLLLGGEAHSLDSISILSNIPWQLKGPDWIEAYDGNRWIPLSETRAMLTSDNSKLDKADNVILRSAKNNDSEANLTGTVVLTPLYDGDAKAEIGVVQLGKYGVAPGKSLRLCNSIATNWKTGVSVKDFYFYISRRALTEAELTDDKIHQWELTDIQNLGATDNLEADTKYYFYTAGIDNVGKLHVNHHILKTATDKDQPIAEIKNVQFDGEYLTFDIQRNSFCEMYLEVTLTNMLDAADAIIAWLLYDHTPKETAVVAGDGGNRVKMNNMDVQVVTWGIAKGTNILGSKISRYVTSYFNSSNINAPWHPSAKAVSMKDIQDAVIDVKVIK